MAHHETELDIAAPIEDVFAVLADIGGWRDWDPSVRTTLATTEGPPAAGSTYEVTVGFYGKAIEQTHEIAEYDAPHRLVVETSGRATGRWEFALIETDGGTHLKWDTTLKLKGIARLLDKGLDLALAGLVDNAVDGLRKRFR